LLNHMRMHSAERSRVPAAMAPCAKSVRVNIRDSAAGVSARPWTQGLAMTSVPMGKH
jgi:hypothetical protein